MAAVATMVAVVVAFALVVAAVAVVAALVVFHLAQVGFALIAGVLADAAVVVLVLVTADLVGPAAQVGIAGIGIDRSRQPLSRRTRGLIPATGIRRPLSR